jgi:peptide/nickel transport system permease protein
MATIESERPAAAPAVRTDASSRGALSKGRAPRRRQRWRPGLTRFLLIRLALIPVSIFAVLVISFLLVALIPQNTALAIIGDDATPERVAQITEALGLDKPIWVQFWDYVVRVAQGDLGRSFYTQAELTTEIAKRIPASLELALVAFVLSLIVGIGIGTAAAFFPRRFPDKFERVWSTVLYAIPEFLLGVVGIYVIFYLLGWVPAPTGRTAIGDTLPPTVTGFITVDSLLSGNMETLGHALERMVLPVLVLGISGSVIYARMTRAALSEALNSQYLEYARALGLKRSVVVRYALVDVRTPLLLYIALGAGSLVGGSAIIETLFSWPGVGALGVSGMGTLDLPVIQAFVLITGVTTLVTFLVLDMLSMILDPRVKLNHDS